MTTAPNPDGTELAQVCWCDTRTRWATPEQIWAGNGWSCKPGMCEPGCEPGAGLTPRGKAGTTTATTRRTP